MKAKVLEIFRSIQGEGRYLGVPQVFVRFAQCNLDCAYCDTPHLINLEQRRAVDITDGDDAPFQEMTVEEVFSEITSCSSFVHSVSFTGGEPLLQCSFLMELLPLLRRANIKVYLETNGILWQSMIQVCDWVNIIAMDVKLPSSTGLGPYWKEHEAFLEVAIEKSLFVKSVITQQTTREDILQLRALIHDVDPHLLLVLQPSSQDIPSGVIQRCQEYQNVCLEKLTNVRIIPQAHKILGIQ